jgi:hypothetical protein
MLCSTAPEAEKAEPGEAKGEELKEAAPEAVVKVKDGERGSNKDVARES